ncbi:Zinc finger, C3HC4 type [Aphelenchoides besseyi]|nr:Zinc finger, C3HC4 type [Aphelenchoides besseyi]KAI6201934.1 Zinc finger, C3HC4 type [Aphelenchoides besseyi]
MAADGEPDISWAEEHSINRGTRMIRQPLLKFHSVHGENLQVLSAGRRARRKDSFCKSLAFSNRYVRTENTLQLMFRPVLIDEIVCVKLAEVSDTWSGVLRFGVTSVDPASFRDIELPKFACPDLTSKSGFWAKALPDRYCVQNFILHFMVDSEGQLHYGINGLSKGVFLNRINVNVNLWAIFDVYGNSKSIEFVDTLSALPSEVHMISRNSIIPPDPVTDNRPNTSGKFNRKNLILLFTELRFHRFCGLNAQVDERGLYASRVGHEFSQGYVFTNRPIKMNEKFTIIVVKHASEFMGGMAFGLTSCDPAKIGSPSVLPADSDSLLERPEYWVCIKNVAVNPVAGDTACFWVQETGEVMFSKNEHSARPIMYVDTTVPLWAFIDLYGTTRKIRLAVERLPASARSSEIARETASRQSTDLNGLTREMAAIRVALPPLINNTNEDRNNAALEVERNIANESVERTHSTHSDIQTALQPPALPARPSYTAPNLLSSLGERVAIPSVTTTPVTRATTRSPAISTASYSSDMLQTNDYSNEARSISATRNISPLVDGLDRPASAPRFASLNSRYNNDLRLSCSPSNLSSNLDSNVRDTGLGVSASNTKVADGTTATSSSFAKTIEAVSSGEGTSSATESECVVCMSERADSVLYRCGHLCMCFTCAKNTMDGSGVCPLCRQIIIDVIRCYCS